MIAHIDEQLAVLDHGSELDVSPGRVPGYQIRWSLKQRLTRWLTRPLGWLQGRIYRRFLQLNAAGVAFWISELPIVFSIAATLTRLRVFDRLQNGPMSAADLAIATGADHGALLRILRTAAVIGLLQRQKDGQFVLSPVGKQFLSDSPNPVSSWTELFDKLLVPVLPQMADAVVQGESLTKTAYGKTCWEVMADIPNATELHDKACGRWTELVVDRVAAAYDFSKIRTVIDVGGGRGSFLSALLKAAPHLQGKVYDRETTRRAAAEMFAQHGVSERAAHECGNFFEAVPAGADLYTIKHVLHDWDDEHALKILRTIREAVPSHGKLLIVEGSVDHDLLPTPSIRSIWDVTQFAATWGKSRTLEEFSRLAHQAGFHLANIYVPETLDSLILECLPVAGWSAPMPVRL